MHRPIVHYRPVGVKTWEIIITPLTFDVVRFTFICDYEQRSFRAKSDTFAGWFFRYCVGPTAVFRPIHQLVTPVRHILCFIDRVSGKDIAIGSVRRSVRPSVSTPSFKRSDVWPRFLGCIWIIAIFRQGLRVKIIGQQV